MVKLSANKVMSEGKKTKTNKGLEKELFHVKQTAILWLVYFLWELEVTNKKIRLEK